MVVKIDNVDAARPQTGLNQADVVYEEEVEGGLTRLAAVFQSQYPAVVGPVRSGRLTDEGIADDLNHPVFAYSGTNAIFLPILRSQPLTDVDGDNHPGLFYRIQPRRLAPQPLHQCRVPGRGARRPAAAPSALSSFVPAGHLCRRRGGAPAAGRRHQLSGRLECQVGLERQLPALAADPERYRRRRPVRRPADRDQRRRPVRPLRHFGMATGEGVPPVPIPEGLLVGQGHGLVPQRWHGCCGAVVPGGALTTVDGLQGRRPGQRLSATRGRTWVEWSPSGVGPALIP